MIPIRVMVILALAVVAAPAVLRAQPGGAPAPEVRATSGTRSRSRVSSIASIAPIRRAAAPPVARASVWPSSNSSSRRTAAASGRRATPPA